jgi:hypothetical protein
LIERSLPERLERARGKLSFLLKPWFNLFVP